jgi:LuxR family transcriptional regulator, quorum-sensing system regulator CciR
MSRSDDVQTFVDLSRQVRTGSDLHGLVQGIGREMGFDYFALVHHVDLRRSNATAGRDITPEFVTLSDYPEAWIERYVEEEIVSNDPVLLASQRTIVGFSWDRMGDLIRITPAHRKIVEQTRRAGIANGFTVPANAPGELNGSCNFAVGPEREMIPRNFIMAQVVGSFAFEAARTLVARLRDVAEHDPVELTQRQLECVVLAARGKSDWEIARILGLSEATVSTYFKHVRERYHVSTRMQAVLRALYEGAIPFSEIF